MSIIKHFKLSCQSDEALSSLERKINKMMLSDKHKKAIEGMSPDELSHYVEDGKLANTAIELESGNFNLLYLNKKLVVKGEKRLVFFYKKRPLHEVDLVVDADVSDIIKLQDFIQNNQYTPIEARRVKGVTYVFESEATTKEHAEHFIGHIKMVAQGLGLKKYGFNYSVTRGARYDYSGFINGDRKARRQYERAQEAGSQFIFKGTLVGPIKPILEIRRTINPHEEHLTFHA